MTNEVMPSIVSWSVGLKNSCDIGASVGISALLDLAKLD